MKTAVISITKKGGKLAALIADGLIGHECDRFAFYRHACCGAESFDDLAALVGGIFKTYDALVFVCACGIAVRAIAPHIVSKTVDPAVVVTDDCGRFAVPVLSGHIGGANALAEKIAEITGAAAVITTATDAGGLFSPDVFAVANNLYISDIGAAKAVAAAGADGKKIGFLCDYPAKNIPDGVFSKSARTGIYIGCKNTRPFDITLRLEPKNIAVGVGCKRGTDTDMFEEFIGAALEKNNIAPHRVGSVHTIDLKRDEYAVTEFCKKRKIPLICHSAAELMAVEGDFAKSDFVLQTTGADNVCERAAAAGGGKIIVRKTAREGMTFAAAEEDISIDFERGIL